MKKENQAVDNSDEEFDTIGDVPNLSSCPDNLVALDCEMVGVGIKKSDALARCSIVDYHGNVVYDQYIKPNQPITDYRTKWSGVLPCHMSRAIPFKVARKQILSIIKDKVIVGHSLQFDFKILKYRKCSSEVRDTSKYLLLRKEAGIPCNQTPSLKRLSESILGREIQRDTHCSVEDSLAAMDLYRIVEESWEKDFRMKTSNFLHDSFWPAWLGA